LLGKGGGHGFTKVWHRAESKRKFGEIVEIEVNDAECRKFEEGCSRRETFDAVSGWPQTNARDEKASAD